MCQLTFINLGDIDLNAVVTYLSAFTNSNHNAQHGFGLANAGKIWKTAISADNLVDLGTIIKDNILDVSPVMSHVRLASKGISLDVENNHPFETAHLIGMHNGTLYLKEESTYTTYSATASDDESKGSDSKRFFEMMDAEYDKNGGKFIEAITTTMALHKGKFAFIIFEKKTGDYYVVRGKTADLHYTNIYIGTQTRKKLLGVLVNTDKSDLEKIAMMAINMYQIMGYGKNYWYDPASEFDKESIFKLKKGVFVKVGELKETSAYAGNGKTSTVTPFQTNLDTTSIIDPEEEKKLPIKATVAIDLVNSFMVGHFLSPMDMDEIFWKIIGKSIAESDLLDFNMVIKYGLPKISANKKLRKLWTTAGISQVFPMFYDDKYGLEFPWMINSKNLIMSAISKYLIDIKA